VKEEVPQSELSWTQREMLPQFKSIDAKQWTNLCSAAGWTETGAALLSWCSGAQASDVWEGFSHASSELSADPVFLRAARLVQSDFLPAGNTLSAVVSNAQGNYYALCAALVARRGSIILDYPASEVAEMPEPFRNFLVHPMVAMTPPIHLDV